MTNQDDRLNYQVGRIAGIVDTLPDRMDAFERATTQRLEELKDAVTTQQDNALREHKELSKRVSDVERRQNYLAGVATAAGGLLGAIATTIVNRVLGTH